MSKPTPGPWRAGGGTSRLIETADGTVAIAMLNLAAPDEVAKANGRLIESAPDLLYELRLYVYGDDPRSARAKRCTELITYVEGK